MNIDTKELARLGAQTRYNELMQEANALVSAFPSITQSEINGKSIIPSRSRPISTVTANKTRRRMSPAQRKAVSQRMKRYWAARRAGRA